MNACRVSRVQSLSGSLLAVVIMVMQVVAGAVAAAGTDDGETLLTREEGARPAILAYQEAHLRDPNFGGLWLETTSRDVVLHIGETSNSLDRFPADAGIAVVYEPVQNALAVLLDEWARVSAVDAKNSEISSLVYVDERINRVVVQPGGAATVDAVVSAVRPSGNLSEVREAVSIGQAVLRGGQTMSSGCTAGFIVKTSSGTGRGVLTAGHCPNASTQSGVSLGAATFEKNSGNADRQIHPFSPVFLHDRVLQNGVTITGRTGIYNGMSMCKYGRMTGTQCGTIESVNASADGLYSLVLTSASIRTYGGDSGGPGYSGGLAVGVTHGCVQNFAPPAGQAPCNQVPGAGQWNKTILTWIDNALYQTGYVML